MRSVNGAVPPGGRPYGEGLAWNERPLGVPEGGSSYIERLPGIYQENNFLSRFLLIFEHILSPIDRTTGTLWAYFDPNHTPDDFLPWLGSWLGLVMDARIPVENRRELLRAAPELYRWRGTRRGLREFIRLYTGFEPEITEPALGEIASNRNLAYRFTVRIRLPRGVELQRSFVETIVEAEKPAFAACSIEIVSE